MDVDIGGWCVARRRLRRNREKGGLGSSGHCCYSGNIESSGSEYGGHGDI
jgi:hypothetical protein